MPDRSRRRTLYICYLSLSDPLVHTQVVAYLAGLAVAGHDVHLLTFETGRLTLRRRRVLGQSLASRGIIWHGLRYHKRPSVPATVYDTLVGAAYAGLLIRVHRLDVLHARTHVPAAMALIGRRLAWPRGTMLVFDIRGLMAEEYEDAGRWVRGSLAFRLTKLIEGAAIRRSAALIVLTDRVRAMFLRDRDTPPVHVIPCCADIEGLRAGPGVRERLRSELGLKDGLVMVYVGKLSGWYMQREMVEFFAFARREVEKLHFVILTQEEDAGLRRELERNLLDSRSYTITSAPPDRVGDYLSAADFAISFIEPAPSKIASSPTKIGEYLAAGLPIVSTAGVGDVDRLLAPAVGTLVDEHSVDAYRDALTRITALVADPATAERCRTLAQDALSLNGVGIPRYQALYRELQDYAAQAR